MILRIINIFMFFFATIAIGVLTCVRGCIGCSSVCRICVVVSVKHLSMSFCCEIGVMSMIVVTNSIATVAL